MSEGTLYCYCGGVWTGTAAYEHALVGRRDGLPMRASAPCPDCGSRTSLSAVKGAELMAARA